MVLKLALAIRKKRKQSESGHGGRVDRTASRSRTRSVAVLSCFVVFCVSPSLPMGPNVLHLVFPSQKKKKKNHAHQVENDYFVGEQTTSRSTRERDDG